MVAMNKELTDTQRQVMETGKELAERLGLTMFPYEVASDDLPLFEGQTVLIVSPHGMNIGTIKVNANQVNRTRYTNFFLNGKLVLQRSQRYNNDEWVPSCGPDNINTLPVGSVIYVS